jgi:hypothetical protein
LTDITGGFCALAGYSSWYGKNRRKWKSLPRGLHAENEYYESILNTAMAEKTHSEECQNPAIVVEKPYNC